MLIIFVLPLIQKMAFLSTLPTTEINVPSGPKVGPHNTMLSTNRRRFLIFIIWKITKIP